MRSHAELHSATNVLIEDKASGTQLIQDLKAEGFYAATRNMNRLAEKIMRMHSVTPTIENGFVYLPEKAEWLARLPPRTDYFPQLKV